MAWRRFRTKLVFFSKFLNGATFANVDLADRQLVTRILERDLTPVEGRIQEAVSRLQQPRVLGTETRWINKDLPPDNREDFLTDFDSLCQG